MTMLSVASLAEGHGPLPDWARSNWPRFSETEIAAVVDVLRSGRVNALQHGDRCRAFERAFAELCDMPHAIALSNGTVALELALRALEIGPGDEVIVTPRTFVASANCIVTCGATPVFADVDPVSQNITAASIARVLTSRTRAILPVHLAGWPCEMDEIMTLARSRNLKVIEDCAQAHGASYHGRPIGSFGDAAAFSFCTDKIISTGGEGGMLLLRDHAVWAKAWAYKDHGKSHAAVSEPAAGRSFRWLHESVGSNYRMTEMQAAIGLEQLARLPEWLRARRRNADVLNDLLGGLPALRLTLPPAGVGHAYYKYYAFVRPERLREGWSRDRIVDDTAESGVACGSGSCPEVYRERAFVDAGLAPPARLANARLLGETSLMLPVDHTLDEAAMREIGLRLRAVALAAGVNS
jgi:dTDP-4-amino-4,6-dideoxygalactose transaminase